MSWLTDGIISKNPANEKKFLLATIFLACSSPFAEKLAEIPQDTLALRGVFIIDTPMP